MAVELTSTSADETELRSDLGLEPEAPPANDAPKGDVADPAAADAAGTDGGDGEDADADADGEDADGEGEGEGETADAGAPKAKTEGDGKPDDAPGVETRSSKKRIKQLNKQLAAERSDKQALLQRLSALERAVTSAPAPAKSETGEEVDPLVALGPRPKQDDFETIDEWQDAYDDYTAKRTRILAEQVTNERLRDRERTVRESVLTEEEMNATRNLIAQIEVVKSGYSDWDAVIEAGKALPFTEDMLDVARRSDVGAHMVYFLNKNPEICRGIASHSPRHQAREMGRLERSIEEWLEKLPARKASETPAGKPADKPAGKAGKPAAAAPRNRPAPAPPPPPSVGGRVAKSNLGPREFGSYKEYEDYRNAQEAAR